MKSTHRTCPQCGTKFDPHELTNNPGAAAVMVYCTKVCKGRWIRAHRTPEQKAHDLALGRQRSAKWYTVPKNRSLHIARNSKH